MSPSSETLMNSYMFSKVRPTLLASLLGLTLMTGVGSLQANAPTQEPVAYENATAEQAYEIGTVLLSQGDVESGLLWLQQAKTRGHPQADQYLRHVVTHPAFKKQYPKLANNYLRALDGTPTEMGALPRQSREATRLSQQANFADPTATFKKEAPFFAESNTSYWIQDDDKGDAVVPASQSLVPLQKARSNELPVGLAEALPNHLELAPIDADQPNNVAVRPKKASTPSAEAEDDNPFSEDGTPPPLPVKNVAGQKALNAAPSRAAGNAPSRSNAPHSEQVSPQPNEDEAMAEVQPRQNARAQRFDEETRPEARPQRFDEEKRPNARPQRFDEERRPDARPQRFDEEPRPEARSQYDKERPSARPHDGNRDLTENSTDWSFDWLKWLLFFLGITLLLALLLYLFSRFFKHKPEPVNVTVNLAQQNPYAESQVALQGRVALRAIPDPIDLSAYATDSKEATPEVKKTAISNPEEKPAPQSPAKETVVENPF